MNFSVAKSRSCTLLSAAQGDTRWREKGKGKGKGEKKGKGQSRKGERKGKSLSMRRLPTSKQRKEAPTCKFWYIISGAISCIRWKLRPLWHFQPKSSFPLEREASSLAKVIPWHSKIDTGITTRFSHLDHHCGDATWKPTWEWLLYRFLTWFSLTWNWKALD